MTARASNDALAELSSAVAELETVADGLAEGERRLEGECQRYRELFDLAPDAYLVLDREGVILDANLAAAALLGVPGATLVGKPLPVYLAAGEAHKLHERLAGGVSKTVADWESTIRPRGLPEFRASIRARAVRDGDGVFQGARLLVHDISEHVRAHEREREETLREASQLRARAQRLEALGRQKADYLSLVSHELRAPVTLIHGYLTMMLDGSLGDVGDCVRQVLPVAIRRCDDISALVDQTVEASALEDGWKNFERRDADLREIASDAVVDAAPFAAIAGRRVLLVAGRGKVPVHVDGARIRTILRNLLENALKYSWEGSEVRCEATAADGVGRVSVSDRGHGIPAAELERLFTRYGRVITPETKDIGGTGLGLYLSRELARLHEGDLRVESVEGEGSTFTLELPLAERG